MAFTRDYDDPDEVMKQLQESMGPGMYTLNQPGQGEAPPFISDPSMILQGWGANLWKNKVDIENELRGNRVLSRDSKQCPSIKSTQISYSSYDKEITESSRYTLPVWMTRDVPQPHTWNLQTDPQYTAIEPFAPVSSRILEKDKSK